MNVATIPPDHVWANEVLPVERQLRSSLTEALGNFPTRCEMDTPDLSLIVQPLEGDRFIVVGRRFLPASLQPVGPDTLRPDPAVEQWQVGLARYYGRDWALSNIGHAADTILDDFAPAVFAREWQLHHCSR